MMCYIIDRLFTPTTSSTLVNVPIQVNLTEFQVLK